MPPASCAPPEGAAGALILLALAALALAAPALFPHDPLSIAGPALLPPFQDWALPLGTDRLGRDVLAGIVHGARTSLAVALAAAATAIAVGTIVGTLAGFVGGLVDEVLMRITDAFQTVPGFLLALAFVSVVGPSLGVVVIAIALSAWTGPARIARAEVLSIRERDYVAAARVIGMRPLEIAFREILPNALPPVLAQSAIIVAVRHPDRGRPVLPRARRPQPRHLGRHDRRGAHGAALGAVPVDRPRHRAGACRARRLSRRRRRGRGGRRTGEASRDALAWRSATSASAIARQATPLRSTASASISARASGWR